MNIALVRNVAIHLLLVVYLPRESDINKRGFQGNSSKIVAFDIFFLVLPLINAYSDQREQNFEFKVREA